MIIVTNRIAVSEGWEEKFEERFRKRAHLVDQAPGFVRNEIHRPHPVRLDRETGEWSPDLENPGCYEVKTWWRSFDDFVAWTKSDSFREAHKNRPPKDMFRGPSQLIVHELFLSSEEG